MRVQEPRESKPGDFKRLSRCTMADSFRFPSTKLHGVWNLISVEPKMADGRYRLTVKNGDDDVISVPWDTCVQLVS